jgi:hypothetical protein
MLDSSEWLKQAQRLAVGSSRRVYHGAESRPNLVVKNTQGHWSAYCHACHDGGRVTKEFVKVQPSKTVVNKQRNDPGFLRPITLYQPDINIPYAELTKFFHSKRMCLDYILHLNPQWSAQDNRIVLSTKDQMVGRDVSGLSKSKWYKYKGESNYMQAIDAGLAGKSVLLTEDLFSACKAQFFAPSDWVCIALMGTSLYNDLLQELLTVRRVVVMLDGDKAGQAGTAKTLKTLRLVGIDVTFLKLGLLDDPKDQDKQWWCNFYTSYNRNIP